MGQQAFFEAVSPPKTTCFRAAENFLCQRADSKGADPLSPSYWAAQPARYRSEESGNAPFEPTRLWERQDEERTKQLLKSFSERFIGSLEIDLERIAGAARVLCAQQGEPNVQPRGSRVERQQSKNPEMIVKDSEQREKLGHKKQDLSRYLDSVNLTDRQRECSSLYWEYGMRKSAIARRLNINRKTLDEHLDAAKTKFRLTRAQRSYSRISRRQNQRKYRPSRTTGLEVHTPHPRIDHRFGRSSKQIQKHLFH